MSEKVALLGVNAGLFMFGLGLGGMIERSVHRTDAEQACSREADHMRQAVDENVRKLDEATKATSNVHAIIREEREETWRRWIAGCTSALTESGEDNALEKCRSRARTYSSLEVHP